MAGSGLFSRHCLLPSGNPQLPGWCQGAGKRPGVSLGSVSASGEALTAGLSLSGASPGLRACHLHTWLWAFDRFLCPPPRARSCVPDGSWAGCGDRGRDDRPRGPAPASQPGFLRVRATGVPLPPLACWPTDLAEPRSKQGELDSCPPRESGQWSCTGRCSNRRGLRMV